MGNIDGHWLIWVGQGDIDGMGVAKGQVWEGDMAYF